MCWKKILEWFHKPDPEPEPEPEYTGRTALMFAINDYPGSANDLRGCLNDQDNIRANILERYYAPDLKVVAYRDAKVTRNIFLSTLSSYRAKLQSGDFLAIFYSGHGTYGIDPYSTEADGYSEALYLYDGCVWDYEIVDIFKDIPEDVTVIFFLDSCFAGGSATRVKGTKANYFKNRFVQTQVLEPTVKKKRAFMKADDINYLVFAGSQENQTSADAYIDGDYCGAFSYCAEAVFNTELTNEVWAAATKTAVDNFGFSQIPILLGKDSNKEKKVFN